MLHNESSVVPCVTTYSISAAQKTIVFLVAVADSVVSMQSEYPSTQLDVFIVVTTV